ncbi:hypothetical protein EEL35_09470 [Muribaculaceae bacterium Isolate-042 (Harlan)]|nr:hypothetical protein EEL35_09470 [Muribaculaceae bacterium Isolate-042 (Harlan)]
MQTELILISITPECLGQPTYSSQTPAAMHIEAPWEDKKNCLEKRICSLTKTRPQKLIQNKLRSQQLPTFSG